jgi:hypothetical protein
MTADEIWNHRIEAEVRSLYFADLTARYTKRKQIITGLSFFLSSAAAATVVGKMPPYVPVVLSSVVAMATAYSIAIGLDRKVSTLSKLHSEWSSLAYEYGELWPRWHRDDADSIASALAKRGREASALATTDAPYDSKAMDKWSDHVFGSYSSPQLMPSTQVTT